MLAALENCLIEALEAPDALGADVLAPVLPLTVKRVAGPFLRPALDEQELIVVTASALEPRLGVDEDALAARSASSLIRRVAWAAVGNQTDFEFPADAGDAVVAEVESPPGRPLRRADDYVVEGRTVRLWRPPAVAEAPGEAVVAWLQGAPARGFTERRAATVSLSIAGWAATAARADEILARSLAPILAAFLEPMILQSPHMGATLRLRLLEVRPVLVGMVRTAVAVDTRTFVTATAKLEVRGDLDLSLAVGTAEEVGTIDTIVYKPVLKLPA